MKLRLASWLLPGVVVIAAAVGLYAWPGAALADVGEGRAAFQKGLCFNCHGQNGEGGFGPSLAGRDLPAERVLRQLRTPFRAMPSFRPDQISDGEASSIAEFLASLPAPAERGSARAVADPNDSEVKKQWIGKGCGQCHGATAAGIVQNWAERGATPLAAVLTRKAQGGRLMPAFRDDQVSDELETAFYGYLTGLVDTTYPVSAGVTASRDGNLTTFSILVNNNIADQAAFIEVKGVLPPGARLVDSWAGGGRGFNQGRFDGSAVGWINTDVSPDRTQGPFVFLVDAGTEPASAYAWIRYITTKGVVGTYTSRPATAAPAATASGLAALDRTLQGIGGRDAIQSLRNFSAQASGNRGLIFEGFRPEDSPVERTSFTVRLNHDISGSNLRLDYGRHVSFLGVEADHKFSEIVAGNLGVIDGVQGLRGGPETTNMLSDRMGSIRQQQRLLNPHVILKEALANPATVRDGGVQTLDGAPHNLLVIDDDISPITLFVNASSGTISKLSTRENDLLRRDTGLEVFFKDWRPVAGGLLFPHDVSMTLGGQVIHQETRKEVQVNQSLDSSLFKFPAGAAPVFDREAAERGMKTSQYYQMFAAVGSPRDGVQTNVTATELAPGVFHLTGGSHNSLLIEQEKGLVLAEAPLDEARSKALLAWIMGKFPTKPITHVIATHHHVDHSGGLRTFAAEGAIVVVHEAARSFWANALKGRSSILPDSLELKGVAAKIEAVPAGASLKLPDAVRPVTVYDTPSEHSVDGVVIVSDKEGILFVSDLFSPGPTAAAGPTALELNNSITKHGISVKVIAGGHGGTNTFEEFKAALAR